MSKYGNRKVEKNGEKFDSVREYERHLVLLDMQKKGEIRNLQRQPVFVLEVNGMRVCKYIGDWRYSSTTYHIAPSGRQVECAQEVVEDAKGFQTPEFKLKWKLCKAIYPQYDWRLS